MEIISYIASVFIGISLGLIGGGGSILTVPVLVTSLGKVRSLVHIRYSLLARLHCGGIRNATMGNVNYKTAVVFTIRHLLRCI